MLKFSPSSLALVLCLFLALPGAPASGESKVAEVSPKHIFIILLENRSSGALIGNNADAPFLNSLAKGALSAANFYGTTHPSLPNYLALISGSTQGIWDNCPAGEKIVCPPTQFSPYKTTGPRLSTEQFGKAAAVPHLFQTKTIIDSLEERRLSCKAYFQSMPEPGFMGEAAPIVLKNGKPRVIPLYAQKHNPFMYFKGIASREERRMRLTPLENFEKDLAAPGLANLVFIVPDQCRNMHGLAKEQAAALGIPDCALRSKKEGNSKLIKLGDEFLARTVGAIKASPAWREDSVIAIIWDEDDYSAPVGCCRSPVGADGAVLGGGKIPAIFVRSVESKPGELAQPANHYTLLRAIQSAWGLECLAESCAVDAAELRERVFGPR